MGGLSQAELIYNYALALGLDPSIPWDVNELQQRYFTAGLALPSARIRPTTVIALGTSITNANSFNAAGNPNEYQNGTNGTGYLANASVYLNGILRVVHNGGISGNTSEQMLARIRADVLNYNPGYCIVESGTPNDIGNAYTVARSIAAHKQIYDILAAANIRVIICTPLPYGLADTANNRLFVTGMRRWQMNYAREKGHILCDWTGALTATDGSGLFKTGYSDGVNGNRSNGIHPTGIAASVMGKILADAIRPFLPDLKNMWLPGTNADSWNLLSNGMFTGTAGSVKPTGVTGNLADIWQSYDFGGSASAGTMSKVARSDGYGEWQQVVLSDGSGGWKIQQQNQAGLGTTWNIGDVIISAVEYEVDSFVPFNPGGSLTSSLTCFGGTGSSTECRTAGAENDTRTILANGVLMNRMVVSASTTRLTFEAGTRNTSATIRFGRAGMYNLTQMVAAGLYDASFLAYPRP